MQECNKDAGWLNGPEITVTTSSDMNGGLPSGSPASGSATSLPKLEGSDAVGWTAIADEIGEQTSGDITCTLSNDTFVPAVLFNTLKGKDLEVAFTLGKGIDWILRGKDIITLEEPLEGNAAASGIDMNVTLSDDINMPELRESFDRLSPASENSPSYQLSLAHTGAFGFSATLRLPMDIADKGRTANIYYYHPDTRELELTAVSTVDENGRVAFDFSHASDYIITIDNGEICKELIEQTAVKLRRKTLYLKGTTGKSVRITPEYPAILKAALDKGLYTKIIRYHSSNPEVAVVTGSGKIIGITPGKAKITTSLTVNGVKKTFTINIAVKRAFLKPTPKR
jgi:hypothetical protein